MRRATNATNTRSVANRRSPVRGAIALLRHRAWQGLILLVLALVLTSCGWRGISNVSIPGGPGNESGSYSIDVQMPDTLAINGNSRVQVADVYVGTIRSIQLKNWVATLTLGLNKDVKLPKNATVKIGQTSLLGSQHVELAAPPNTPPQLISCDAQKKDKSKHDKSQLQLCPGDTIPLANSSAFPTTEQTLASLALILRGGGIPNLERLQNELNNVVVGRGQQIHDFLTKLDLFVSQVNDQRNDINHAIDSTDRLLAYVSRRDDVIDRVLTDVPPLIKYLADPKYIRDLINAGDSLGRISGAAAQYLGAVRGSLHTDLQALQCPLRELGRASPDLLGALKLILTQPFDVDTAPQVFRGDYFNISIMLDVTYSADDNAFLTGTGLSGALRALEQSFGRDPETMIPDVRYTPNPNDAPGGPLVERADRNC